MHDASVETHRHRPQRVNGTFILLWWCDVIKQRRAPASVVIHSKVCGFKCLNLNCSVNLNVFAS